MRHRRGRQEHIEWQHNLELLVYVCSIVQLMYIYLPLVGSSRQPGQAAISVPCWHYVSCKCAGIIRPRCAGAVAELLADRPRYVIPAPAWTFWFFCPVLAFTAVERTRMIAFCSLPQLHLSHVATHHWH